MLLLNDCAFVSIRIICDRADANAVKVTEDTQTQAMEKYLNWSVHI